MHRRVLGSGSVSSVEVEMDLRKTNANGQQNCGAGRIRMKQNLTPRTQKARDPESSGNTKMRLLSGPDYFPDVSQIIIARILA